MSKIYVGLMDNGSEDVIIHVLALSADTCLKHLQKKFLQYRTSPEDLEGIKDPSAPTLEEMNNTVGGNGVDIIAVEDGAALYQELRNFDWDVAGCKSIKQA